MAKTVVGLFEGPTEAQRVVEHLIREGFRREDIGLISQHSQPETAAADEQTSGTAVGVGAGALVGGLGGLLVGLGALSIPGIGPVLAAGPIAGALAGAGIGAAAGGVLGMLTDLGIPEDEARHYAEGVRRGGTLVTVMVPDDIAADRAIGVMYEHGPIDLEERAARWRERGWSQWDPTSPPMTGEDARLEREMYRSTTASQAGAPSAVGQPVEGQGVYGGMRDRQGRSVRAYAPMKQWAGARVDRAEVDPDWRRHYQTTLAGESWDECSTAYQFGYDLEVGGRRAVDWQALEPEARRRWEAEHPGTWDRFKNAIHYAWERARGRRAA